MPSASVTEEIVLTESHLGDIAPAFMGDGESIVLAESLILEVIARYEWNFTQDVTVSESVTVFFQRLIPTATETVAVADDISGSSPGSANTVSVSEAIQVTDAPTPNLSVWRITLIDTVTLTEIPVVQRAISPVSLAVSIDESIGVLEDLLGDVSPAFQGEGETVVLTDSVTLSFVLRILRPITTETVTVSDTITSGASGSTATLLPSVIETMVVSEALLGRPTRGVTLLDELAVVETATVLVTVLLPALTIVNVESIKATDTIPTIYPGPDIWTYGERIVVADSSNVKIVAFIGQARDTITVTEIITLRIPRLRPGVDDTVIVTEDYVAYISSFPPAVPLILQQTESVVVADDPVAYIAILLVEQDDGITVSESVIGGGLHVYPAISETIAVEEGWVDIGAYESPFLGIVITPFYRSASDTVTVSESLSVTRTPLVPEVGDTLVLVEALTCTTSDLKVGVLDAVVVTETYVYGDLQPGTVPVTTLSGPTFLYVSML